MTQETPPFQSEYSDEYGVILARRRFRRCTVELTVERQSLCEKAKRVKSPTRAFQILAA